MTEHRGLVQCAHKMARGSDESQWDFDRLYDRDREREPARFRPPTPVQLSRHGTVKQHFAAADAVKPEVPLTADTVTDEQIRELRDAMRDEQRYERWPDGTGAMMNVTDLALQRGRGDSRRLPTPAAVRAARARCAEIINARRDGAE